MTKINIYFSKAHFNMKQLLFSDGMVQGYLNREPRIIKNLSLILLPLNEIPRPGELLNFSAKYQYLFLVLVIQQPPVRVNHRKSWRAECGPGVQASLSLVISWHSHWPCSWAFGMETPASSHLGHLLSIHGCLVLAIKARAHQGQGCSLDRGRRGRCQGLCGPMKCMLLMVLHAYSNPQRRDKSINGKAGR